MLADGLVDELHLFVYPLTRGPGPRLFSEEAAPGKLSLAACESYDNVSSTWPTDRSVRPPRQEGTIANATSNGAVPGLTHPATPLGWASAAISTRPADRTKSVPPRPELIARGAATAVSCQAASSGCLTRTRCSR